MNVKDFSLEAPKLSAGEILKAIETAIPQETIDEAIVKTGCKEDRNRKLPTYLVICMVIAMSLWASDAMKDVLKNLIKGSKRFPVKVGSIGGVPVKSAITKARKRVGPRVMSELFNQLTRPLATEQTPGAILGGWRIVLIDGTSINLPDTSENARVFGYPGTRKGTPSLPSPKPES